MMCQNSFQYLLALLLPIASSWEGLRLFAMKNPPLPSFLDGIGNGLGYSVVLLAVGFFVSCWVQASYLALRSWPWLLRVGGISLTV